MGERPGQPNLPANSRAHTGAKEANVYVALHHLENKIKSNN